MQEEIIREIREQKIKATIRLKANRNAISYMNNNDEKDIAKKIKDYFSAKARYDRLCDEEKMFTTNIRSRKEDI